MANVHIAKTPTQKLVCIVDEWHDEGTALIEDVNHELPARVGIWRKAKAGPELGDATVLALEFDGLNRRDLEPLLNAALLQFENWGVDAF